MMKQSLLFIFLLFSLAACEGGSSDNKDNSNGSNTTENGNTNGGDVDGSGDTDGGDTDGGDTDGGDTDGGDTDGGTTAKCFNYEKEGGPVDGSMDRIENYPFNSAHVLVYKFNFSDEPVGWSDSEINTAMEEVKEYYNTQSYCQFGTTWEIAANINLTARIADYTQGSQLCTDWWQVAKAEIESTNTVNYDEPGGNRIIMILGPEKFSTTESCYRNSTAGYSRMNIYHHKPGTIAHEMGHAMGLHHAKAVDGGDAHIPFYEDPMEKPEYNCQGLTGSAYQDCNDRLGKILIDYGNIHSMMGMGAHTLEEYNLLYKHFYGWLDLKTDVPLIEKSGKYRINAFGHGDKSKGQVGLRLKSGHDKYTYWVEFRTSGTTANQTNEGVMLNLQGYAEKSNPHKSWWKTISYLVDTTPGSFTADKWWGDDQKDSVLKVGKSYKDYWGGFEITVLERSVVETGADAWIDVQIDMLK